MSFDPLEEIIYNVGEKFLLDAIVMHSVDIITRVNVLFFFFFFSKIINNLIFDQRHELICCYFKENKNFIYGNIVIISWYCSTLCVKMQIFKFKK